MAMLMELSRLKLQLLQLLLDRKLLKVVKPQVKPKEMSRKQKCKLSLKRALKKMTLTLAHLRLKKWLNWLKSIRRDKTLLN